MNKTGTNSEMELQVRGGRLGGGSYLEEASSQIKILLRSAHDFRLHSENGFHGSAGASATMKNASLVYRPKIVSLIEVPAGSNIVSPALGS